ncbi:hypothetical protein ACHAWT_004552 [Skeletonema menzelii]
MTGTENSEQQLLDDSDGLAAAKKKERVKARWSLLRETLMGSKSFAATSKHSMNSFAGFQVLDRKFIEDSGELSDLFARCPNLDEGQDGGALSSWDFVQNSYTCKEGRKIQFITREVKRLHQQSEQQLTSQSSMKSRVEALLSHRNHGVDNTGNVRVWDAEATLAGFLLSVLLCEEFDDLGYYYQETSEISKIIGLRSRIKNALFAHGECISTDGCAETCNVLELGAGQAGLAGLGLASATNSFDGLKPLKLVLTDGHPKCVENNRVCSSTIMPKRKDAVSIDSQLLLWDSSANGAEECERIVNECRKSSSLEESSDEGLFHLCLASDCVHFQEFHDGMFVTIARTLAVGGIALLCQPRRGSSLSNFMTLIDAVNSASASSGDVPLFQMDLMEDFHPKVSKVHRSIATTSTCYDPNWHRPMLLVMTKLRSFDEDIDGRLARKFVKTYINVK